MSSRWTFGAVIGRGAFGTTYLASDETGRQAVAKVLRVAEAQDWKTIELFEREARVLEALSHPGIPRYIEHKVEDGGTTLVLIMERARGVTLASRVGTPIACAQVESWLRQGLQILQYLHTRMPPVVHRDVTTTNLLVDGDRLTLVDFGSVKATLAQSTVMTTVGTFGFMAPEQLRGLAVPARDLYGLGVSMACVACGVSPEQLPVDAATGAIEVPALPGASARLRSVLGGLLAPGLRARFASASDALALLDVPLTPALPGALAASAPRSRPLAIDFESGQGIGEGIARAAFWGGAMVTVLGILMASGQVALAARGNTPPGELSRTLLERRPVCSTKALLEGASSARREEGAYRGYVTDEQRRDAPHIPAAPPESKPIVGLGGLITACIAYAVLSHLAKRGP